MTAQVIVRNASATIAAETGETILAAALRADIAYPHSCQQGRCGACRSLLLAGEVELLAHSRFALASDERDAGLILACRAVPRSDVRVAWLSDTKTAQARVIAKHEVAAKIFRVVVEAHRGGRFDFNPGQYFDVGLPGARLRSFSPANQPGEHQLEFYIRPVPNGQAGEVVRHRLSVGDKVTLHGPFGDAYLRETHAGPLLAAAAGSGLAPIKSIVDRALAVNPGRQVHLYASARTASRLYLVDYFREVARRFPAFRFETVVTGARPGVRPLRVPDLISERYSSLRGWVAHMAGPPGFVEAVVATASEKGLNPHHTFADAFWPQTQGHDRRPTR